MSATEQHENAGNSLDLRKKSRYKASLRLSVAPMMDWTDRWCRGFHRVLAPHARLYTEMLHANAVLHGNRDALLGHDAGEHPLALQLGGSEPAVLAAAARIGADWGHDEINLNCGCPSDRVQAGRFGACLMREPVLVADCVAAMRAALPTTVPVTVKCRLGVDDDHEWSRFRRFIDTVAEAGCGVFVVHARNAWLQGLSPKENRQVPPLRHDWAHRLKAERPELQVVVNGGIADAALASAQLAHVDGVMLGRAAYHDPYLLHRLDVAWFGGELQSRETLLRRMQGQVEAAQAAGVSLSRLSRHWLGLFHGERGGRHFRQILSGGEHAGEARGWARVERALAATWPDPAQLPGDAATAQAVMASGA